MPSVFISYSRVDTNFVRRLHDALKAAEYEIWVDWEDIPPSATWTDEIRTGVTGADAFIYVISPDSVASEVCGRELGWAVERNKRIVPVVHREPDGAKVPEVAAALNWVFLRDSDDFDAGVATLTSAVETDLDHVRTHTRLGIAAGRWNESGRDRSQLLRGQELAAAEAWLVGGAGLKPEPTQLQREYVLASRQSATRRQRTVIGAVTFGLAVAIVLAIVALVQRSSAIHERNVAQAGELDAVAQRDYPSDPEESVLYALKGAQITPSSTTEGVLRESLSKSQMRVRYSLGDLNGVPVSQGDAVWSPDGQRLLVTSPGVWARIYSPGSGKGYVSLAGTTSAPHQSAWDALGNRVVLGGHDTAVYDAQTGAVIRRWPVESVFVALTPDGSEAVAVETTSTGAVSGRVFDVASGRLVSTFEPRFSGGATCFALSPTGTLAAQCDSQTTTNQNTKAALDIWNVQSGRLVRSVPSASLISSVAFNPDGSEYVFTNTGMTVNTTGSLSAAEIAAQDNADAGAPSTFVYKTAAATGPPLIEFGGGPASAAAFGPSLGEPEVAYALLNPAEIELYNFAQHKSVTLLGPTDTINSLSFSRDGLFLVAGSQDKTARVFDTVYGGAAVEVLAGAEGGITSASFGMNDTRIATTSIDGTTRVWAGPLPRPTVTVPGIGIPSASVGFNADGTVVLNTTRAGQGEVLAASDLRVLSRFSAGPGLGFGGAALSADGRYVFAATGPYDTLTKRATPDSVFTFDAATGREIARMPATPAGPIIAAADLAGNRLVTIGATGIASEWDPRTGRLLHTLEASGGVPGAVVFSRDGSQIAIVRYPNPLPTSVTIATSFGSPTVDLWSASSGHLIRAITADRINSTQIPGELPYAPLAAAFSPDDGTLAVAGGNQYIELYNTHTGALLKELATQGTTLGNYAVSLAYSPNGQLFAAGAGAGTYVWRLPGYQPLAPFQQEPVSEAPVVVGDGLGVTVGFTSDSSTMITQGATAIIDTVQAWNPNLVLQLESLPATRGTLNPQGTQFVGVNSTGVSLYPCDLCGGLTHLTTLARTRITLPPSFQAQLLKNNGG